MTYEKLEGYHDWLLERELFTEAELQLITHMYGYNIETLNLAVFSRWGYQTVEDLIAMMNIVQK